MLHSLDLCTDKNNGYKRVFKSTSDKAQINEIDVLAHIILIIILTLTFSE